MTTSKLSFGLDLVREANHLDNARVDKSFTTGGMSMSQLVLFLSFYLLAMFGGGLIGALAWHLHTDGT